MSLISLFHCQSYDIFWRRGRDLDGSVAGEDRPVRSRAGRVASIRWTVGPVFRGQRFDRRRQSIKAARYVSYGHRTRALHSLLSPAKPTDKTYDQLVEKLTEHYSPTPSEVMQRFRFNSRSRKTGESVAAYVAESRRLAEHCNYGDTLSVMLRDRLINDGGIQKKLLPRRTIHLLLHEPWL